MICNICNKEIAEKENAYQMQIGFFKRADDGCVDFIRSEVTPSAVHFICYQESK